MEALRSVAQRPATVHQAHEEGSPAGIAGLVQKPQNFVDAVEISEAVETKVQRLPDLVGQYPVRFSDGARLETGLVRQAWSTLEAARDFCFDAMCISLRRRSV